MNGYDYGQLVEGDFGILTYQGTRYHSFNRHKRRVSIESYSPFIYLYLIKYLANPASVSSKYSMPLPAGMNFCASFADK